MHYAECILRLFLRGKCSGIGIKITPLPVAGVMQRKGDLHTGGIAAIGLDLNIGILHSRIITLRQLGVPQIHVHHTGSAMLAALGAESVSGFVPSSVVKIGYGAGKSELQTLPNILRVVIGEGNSDSVMFSAEEIGADFCQSDYAIMKES